MKSFAYAPIFAAVASAATLIVEAEGELNGRALGSVHEGAGINYFFVSDGTQGDDLTLENGNLVSSASTPNIPFVVNFLENILTVGVTGASNVEVNDGAVTIDGQSNFQACNQINDPYRYSGDRYAIVNGDGIGQNCVPISLRLSGDEASSSVAPSSVPSSSAVLSAPYSNTTVTTDITVTDYTTYCPVPTTITITTCDTGCAPHTITVDEPKTITVTGECIVPAPTTVKPTEIKPTSESKPTTPVTSAAPSSQAAPSTISTYDNMAAGKQIFGLTGLALAGAMLL